MVCLTNLSQRDGLVAVARRRPDLRVADDGYADYRSASFG
jgi:hypothetical protein